MEKQEFDKIKESFIGTEAYYSLKPLSNIRMTDGAAWVHSLSSVVTDISILVEHTPELAKEAFLSAKVTVDDKRVGKYIIDDGDGRVLYTSGDCNYDLPQNIECLFYIQNQVILLSNEY